MTNNKKTGSKIRGIMKISAQLVGPDDQSITLNINLNDSKDPNVPLLLPPQLNPIVYQWSIKIYRGRNMRIDADWFSKIDPFIRVTIGKNSIDTEYRDNTENPEYNTNLYIPSNFPSMIREIKFELMDKETIGEKLLATAHLNIKEFEKLNSWNQFFWLNF